MGRDTMLYIFIGRKCTDEEICILKIKTETNDDYYDYAHIFELNPENPFMEIDGYPVVLICNKNGDGWYICEKFIVGYDIEHQEKPIEFDDISATSFKSENNRHKLMLVAEISY